jgi:diguanylate cyclase
VVTIVFGLALANFVLGFAMAIVFERFSVISASRLQRGPKPKLPANSEASCEKNGDLASPLSGESPLQIDLDIEPQSAVEELLWGIKLRMISHREQVIELDRSFFDSDEPADIADKLNEALKSLHALIESWISQVDTDEECVGARVDALEELLLDQAFQLRSCIDGLELAEREDVARHLATGMSAINTLRDRTDALLCDLLRDEQRLQVLTSQHRTFGECETLTRLGMAALFDQWWADDPERVRLVSVLVIDLDRFEPFTQRIGAAHGDTALLRLGELLHDLVRKDRGFDRVSRFSGQRFVLFLGDTGSRNAAKGAARIREAIESTSFKLGEDVLELTASVAVIEVGKSEQPSDFLQRLDAALDECKKAGRNCGFVDSGNGPEEINLPQYPENIRVIELDDVVAV